MPASDGIILGEPAIGPEYFNAPHFEESFTTVPSLPSANDPNNTGKFDDEHWLHGKGLEGGWADGPELGGYVVNKEKQRYTSSRAPSPDGWSPFERTSEGLLIKAREVPDTPQMRQWAVGKRYGEKPPNGSNAYGGQDLFVTDFASEADIPGVKNVDWFLDGDGRVRWDRWPMDWQSGILSTGNGRASIDQGEIEFVAKVPIGSFWQAGNDATIQSCAFAALWLIEQIIVGKGRNQETLGGGITRYPFTGSSYLNELDFGECGGFDPYTNHNSRHMHDGRPIQFLTDGEAKYLSELNMQHEFFRIKGHVTFDKIGFAIGPADGVCKYTRVLPTPSSWRETRREYELDSNNTANVVMENNIPVERGDLIIDGEIQRRQFMGLANVAMDGLWLRERMCWERDTILNRGYTYPAYQLVDGLKQCHMTMRYMGMRALTEAKFLKANGGFYEPHKNGTSGGGTTVDEVHSNRVRPVTGLGIRSKPSIGAGIQTWQLEDPDAVGPGRWVYDGFGDEATLIGTDTGPTLTLDVSAISEDKARFVSFKRNLDIEIPDPVITHSPIEGLYVPA